MRYGRYVLITPEKIEQAEIWSSHYGTVGVFISRLLPVIRHLIGIPAGVVRMHYGWYSLATIAGSALWCSVLVLGGRHGRPGRAADAGQPAPHHAVGRRPACCSWASLYYFFVHRHMRR